MKNFQLLTLVFALFSMTAFLQSCKDDDPCEDVTCQNDGVCLDGTCDCSDGFEGENCNIEWATKFLGTNMATQDTCYGDNGNFKVSYNMSISRISEKKLSSTNLGGFGATNTVEIDILNSENLNINYTDVASRVFTGSGTITNNLINLDYIVTYSDNTKDTCQAIITK